MAVVYEHIRNDTNEVFYVGIGKTPKRAFSKKSRNPLWKNIVNKTDYTVEIIHNDVSWGEACELEKHLIFLFGRKDLGLGSLVNMTDGGEGVVNKLISDKTRGKLSEANKGNKNGMYGKTKELCPFFGKKHSEETKKNIANTLRNKEDVKGFYFDEETNKYRVRINIGGKRIHLGRFNTPSEAEEAYKNARIKYFS